MRPRSLSLLGLSASLALLLLGSSAIAQPAPPKSEKSGTDQIPRSEIAQYCLNNANATTDAHLAWQRDQLAKMEDELKQKIAELQTKEDEYKKWVAARQELLDKGKDGVVAIFSHMRPDAAALQLSAMEDDTAAAVLAKLNPRDASAILDEIDPQRAARLTDVMAGKIKTPPEAKKSL